MYNQIASLYDSLCPDLHRGSDPKFIKLWLLKWRSVSHPLTKVRYRAARAAKNGINLLQIVSLQNSGYDKDIVINMYLSLQSSTYDIMALKVAKEHTRCRKVGEESLNI